MSTSELSRSNTVNSYILESCDTASVSTDIDLDDIYTLLKEVKDSNTESNNLAKRYQKNIKSIDLKLSQLETRINNMYIGLSNKFKLSVVGKHSASNSSDVDAYYFPSLHFGCKYDSSLRNIKYQFQNTYYNEVGVYLALENACDDSTILRYVRANKSKILGFSHKIDLFEWLGNIKTDAEEFIRKLDNR